MSGTVQTIFRISMHSNLKTNLLSRNYEYLHFRNEKTEVQRVVELGLELGDLTLKAELLNSTSCNLLVNSINLYAVDEETPAV